MANNVSDLDLFTACHAEAKEPPINLSVLDPSPFMLAPMGIRSVLKMSDVILTMETNKVKIKSDGS